MINSSLDHIEYVRTRPVCQLIPDNIRIKIEEESLPSKCQSLSSICDKTLNYIIL